MDIIRYIVWTTSFDDTNIIMDVLKPHATAVVSVTDVIICVETELSAGKIRTLVGDAMEMAVLEITDNFIEKLMNTQFLALERKNFQRFLDLTKVPKTIDEALDLINDKGGVDLLTNREKAALDKLTGASGTT